MKDRKIWLALSGVLILALAGCGDDGDDNGNGDMPPPPDTPPSPEDQVEFSATINYYQDGEVTSTYKYYQGEEAYRMELDQPYPLVMISYPQEVTYYLYPEFDQYQEFPWEEPEEPENPIENPEVDCEKEGEEVITGRNTDLYYCYEIDGDGKSWIWIDPELDFAMQSANGSIDNIVMKVTEIDIGDQLEDLFEIPAGYTLVEENPYLGNFQGATQELMLLPSLRSFDFLAR